MEVPSSKLIGAPAMTLFLKAKLSVNALIAFSVSCLVKLSKCICLSCLPSFNTIISIEALEPAARPVSANCVFENMRILS